jgi:hypothetical protein
MVYVLDLEAKICSQKLVYFIKLKLGKFCYLKIWRVFRMADERLSVLGRFIFVEGVLVFAFVMLLHLDCA